MIPKNFPGRVNDRRKGALARLANHPKNEIERAVLTSKILPDMVARSQRSKKDHSHLARFRKVA